MLRTKLTGSRHVRLPRFKAATAVAVATASLLALSACTPGANTNSSAPVKSITVLVEAGGHAELQPIADLYKKDTGVKVNFVELPYNGLYNRVNSELSTGSVSFDVAALDAIWLPTFAAGLQPLNDLYTPAVKADNFPSVVQEAKVGANYVGMPAFTNSEILYYRTDLFNDSANKAAFKAKYGYDLKPPTTWQQYADVAAFFTKNGMYGAPLPGAEETQYLAALSQAGEKEMVLNAAGTKSTLGDAASLKALNYYTSLAKYAPAGAAAVDWNAAQNLYNQGKSAMMLFWAHAYRQIPTSSPVYGKTAVAPMVAGPAGIAGVPGPYYLSIPRQGPHQSASLAFVKFAYDHNALSATTSLGLVARISALHQYENKPGYAAYKPMITTLSAPATITRPANANWQNIVNNALIPMIQKSLQPGADNAALLKAAAAQIDQIVQQ
ncbi:extracellular solute-binding protein [Arthrobacter sp. SDTb3-6]|uniref:extracellular solute-binding protein n=1 Tax=Arthrobacter sp. SDTb3-6 TaxID=2713571 RepID=UPI00159D7978|nr:extracellular solute-binding protein [Arthrobacter sp. SDTb3-6]NVN00641.1 extracellular solute-binding protein [Arthrobacter sp. SDTb3-6]